MKRVIKESLFEQQDENFKFSFNIEDEMNYLVDIESAYAEDPDVMKQILDAIKEFGVRKENIAALSSFGTSERWENIKNELDRKQIEYYEFDTDDGESIIFFNANDIESDKNEKQFRRQWGGGSAF